MNKVILMGRLVADSEVRYTQNNVPMCRFRLAVNKPGKPKEGQSSAEFLNIVAWRSTAEFAGKYFKKGMQVLVEGHLRTHTWDDNGTKRYEEYTQADKLFFADSKRDNPSNVPQGTPGTAPSPQYTASTEDGYYSLSEDDEDLPF